MSTVKGASNMQSESTKKKVHFENGDAEDAMDSGDSKFISSPIGDVSHLRLRHIGEDRRSFGTNYNEQFNGKFFTISPAHKLLFPSGQDKDGNAVLTLTNDHSGVVAYKVKTTAPSKYRVRPGHGILAPGAKAEVVITLIAGHSVNGHSQDKFLILGMEIKNESIDQNELNELWRTCTKDKLMEHKLFCDQLPAVSEVEPSLQQTVDHSAIENLRSQNDKLVKEIRSLKTTVVLMLILQVITIIVTAFIFYQLLWAPESRHEASVAGKSVNYMPRDK